GGGDDERGLGLGHRLVRYHDKTPGLLRRRCRGDRREGITADRRGYELAREVERFARARGYLLSADQGSEEHSDSALLRHETRDEKTRWRPDPFRLIWHRPVEEDRAVRRERIVGQLKREKTTVVKHGIRPTSASTAS